MTVKAKRIQFRFRDIQIWRGMDHNGESVWGPLSVRHARLFNPLTDRWHWYWGGDEIPNAVMAYLWPEEREQVRRLLINPTKRSK